MESAEELVMRIRHARTKDESSALIEARDAATEAKVREEYAGLMEALKKITVCGIVRDERSQQDALTICREIAKAALDSMSACKQGVEG
jgi:hypothetical protein